MNKAILSLLGCSSSIAAVLGTSSIASPDIAQTIPYPEVMNLSRVPTFDARGIVSQKAIARNISPRRYKNKQPMAKVKPVPINVDLVSKTVGGVAIHQHGGDLLGYRNFAPSMMVLGYSSPGDIGMYPRTVY
jgi:hypothetical protein